MDNNVFMGMLIASIVVLFAIATGVATLIVRPIINLNKSITKLELSISTLNKTADSMETKITKQDEKINSLGEQQIKLESRISLIEGVRNR